MYQRLLKLPLSASQTCFLWGPRQTGKSTLLRLLFPDARRYDLLLADEFRRLVNRPESMREELAAEGITGNNQGQPIIIDEVQKAPGLLDEVHWLIENRGLRFILCGSSARKLKRGHGNLLGGRAIRYELFPLVYPEIPDFSLERALNHGAMPRHYKSEDPARMLSSYIDDYLREEIAAEALTRNIGAFGRFLEVAAISNGEMVNFVNIARDCSVSAPTAKGYFEILEDTLLGRFLPSFRKKAKRRVIHAPKFYFFDIGILAALIHRQQVAPGSELFGRAFEHFIFLELTAQAGYSETGHSISYWRTASGIEIDFVLGDAEIAIEAKAVPFVQQHHLKGLRAFKEDFTPRRAICVSLDPKPRKTEDNIEILPWKKFLEELWGNGLVR